MSEAARGSARHFEIDARADKENVDALDREQIIHCRCPMRRSCWRCSIAWRRFACRLRSASRSDVRPTTSDLHKFASTKWSSGWMMSSLPSAFGRRTLISAFSAKRRVTTEPDEPDQQTMKL